MDEENYERMTTRFKAFLETGIYQDRCPHGVWVRDCFECKKQLSAQQSVQRTLAGLRENWRYFWTRKIR